MLLDGNPEPRRNLRRALSVSLVLHLLSIAALVYRPAPKVLLGFASLRGNGGRGRVIALAAPGVSALTVPRLGDDENHRLLPPAKGRRPKPAPAPAQAAAAQKELMPGMPGFILGSLANGLPGEHDVRVAVSIVAPDPPIARSRLPRWINGDVVVEVTIDEQGQVIGTRVLQSIGFGLDEIIVETLRHWRYIPAKVDGVAVASREDVHFHFPS